MEDITIPVNRHVFSDVKDVFRRVCHDPPVRYKQLACAYYRTAYRKCIPNIIRVSCAAS